MVFTHLRSTFKLGQIKRMFQEGSIMIDTSYQRRKVWNEKDKVRLIETILMGYVIPELFFWDAETDPETGVTLTHIVDGQQRINAVIEFAEGTFKLDKESMLSEEMKTLFGDKSFADFTDEERVNYWTYELSIVQIVDESLARIKEMFKRLNLTNYNLNDQERRHGSDFSLFNELSHELSEHPFWDEYSLFNRGDVRRMKDVEFCSTLILLVRKGIIDQTRQKPLNDAHIEFNSSYPGYEDDKMKIFSWISHLSLLINKDNIKFFRKKSQLYSMFSIIRYVELKNLEFTENNKTALNTFIETYLDFKNDSDKGTKEGTYDYKIRKYKLASSEGLNKLKNRSIRFKILKELILDVD